MKVMIDRRLLGMEIKGVGIMVIKMIMEREMMIITLFVSLRGVIGLEVVEEGEVVEEEGDLVIGIAVEVEVEVQEAAEEAVKEEAGLRVMAISIEMVIAILIVIVTIAIKAIIETIVTNIITLTETTAITLIDLVNDIDIMLFIVNININSIIDKHSIYYSFFFMK